MAKIIPLDGIFTHAKQNIKNVFHCKFMEDGTLTYVNNLALEIFGLAEGDNFIKALPEHRQEKVMNRIKRLSKDKPVSSYIEKSMGVSIRWTNRAIFDDNGNIVEYEGVGWLIKEQETMAVQGQIRGIL